MKRAASIIAVMGVLWLTQACAALAQQKTSPRYKVLPVPALGYSPETHTYVGAVTLITADFFADSLTRASNFKVEFNYTWNRQAVGELEWDAFSRREKWATKGRVHVSRYPDLYYGIGPSTPSKNEIHFESDRIVAEGRLLRQAGRQWFLGGQARWVSYRSIRTDSSSLAYPELHSARASGAGFVAMKDSRDHLLTPGRGVFAYFGGTPFFSDEPYAKLVSDFRIYGTRRAATFAGRWYNEWTVGKAPFFDLAMLGGDEYVRGYYLGRYRDRHMSAIQAEYRQSLVWRLGLSAFGGMSMLYGPSSTFERGDLMPNGGVGLRFLVDKHERTNLRLDFALGREGSSAFYVAFGEAF